MQGIPIQWNMENQMIAIKIFQQQFQLETSYKCISLCSLCNC